ncbi:hypothetical protein D3C87_2140590 [compost metagenome]
MLTLITQAFFFLSRRFQLVGSLFCRLLIGLHVSLILLQLLRGSIHTMLQFKRSLKLPAFL